MATFISTIRFTEKGIIPVAADSGWFASALLRLPRRLPSRVCVIHGRSRYRWSLAKSFAKQLRPASDHSRISSMTLDKVKVASC